MKSSVIKRLEQLETKEPDRRTMTVCNHHNGLFLYNGKEYQTMEAIPGIENAVSVLHYPERYESPEAWEKAQKATAQ